MDKTALKHFLFIFGALLLCTALLLWAAPAITTQALPEYAAQTGEPCATCHVSPSGGGPRTPRGQAWVAEGKTGSVPDLTQALELLGVKLTEDTAYYTVAVTPLLESQPLSVKPAANGQLNRWLEQYDGN
jgi:mono/diheme cytochrome c family protein